MTDDAKRYRSGQAHCLLVDSKGNWLVLMSGSHVVRAEDYDRLRAEVAALRTSEARARRESVEARRERDAWKERAHKVEHQFGDAHPVIVSMRAERDALAAVAEALSRDRDALADRLAEVERERDARYSRHRGVETPAEMVGGASTDNGGGDE